MKRLILAITLISLAVGWGHADFAGTGFSSPPLPSQSGNSGKVLTTDGSTASWGTSGASGITDNSITGGKLTSNIVIATTGTITGALSVLDNVSGPTAAQSYGSMNLVNANITVLLPTAVAGMAMCVVDGGATHDNVIVDVQATDNIILLGTTQAGGLGITNSGGTTLGDYVCVVSLAANKWRVFGYQGTWASQ